MAAAACHGRALFHPTVSTMKVLARNAQTPDDTRLWSPSLVDAVGKGLPKPDPLALLMAEQRRDGSALRLLFSAIAALTILALAASLLG
jgi:hypothetical protein